MSREITGPFVKCKIRNASPQKWNKPRHTGVEASRAVVAVRQQQRRRTNRKGDVRGEGNPLRVRLCVSFISTDIIIALRGRS